MVQFLITPATLGREFKLAAGEQIAEISCPFSSPICRPPCLGVVRCELLEGTRNLAAAVCKFATQDTSVTGPTRWLPKAVQLTRASQSTNQRRAASLSTGEARNSSTLQVKSCFAP